MTIGIREDEMRLSIKNIGKIENASIEINGITIVAGENNTGKSTIGRALFSVFNGFYKVDEKIDGERCRSIEKLINLIYQNVDSDAYYLVNTKELAEDLLNNVENYKNDIQAIEEKIIKAAKEYDDEFVSKIEDTNVREFLLRIKELLNISDDEVLRAVLEKSLIAEFNGQINNIFADGEGGLELQIRNKKVAISVRDNRVIKLQNSIRLLTEAIYLDDPFILDGERRIYYKASSYITDHKTQLRRKLTYSKRNANLIEEIAVKNRLEKVFEKLSQVCGGVIVRDRQAGYGYQRKNGDKVLNIRNVSAGLKTFVILKQLLQSGAVEYNGTIILDEPEIHLHPEWQLIFAELIVLLHKEFGLHVLLNTHSPYFLRAMQVYSAKHEVADRCKYYLAGMSASHAVIEDVSENIDKIYQILSIPLQKLEDERW